MKDGIYLEIFALSNGVRANIKMISLDHLVKSLSGAVMDKVFEVITPEPPKEEEK